MCQVCYWRSTCDLKSGSECVANYIFIGSLKSCDGWHQPEPAAEIPPCFFSLDSQFWIQYSFIQSIFTWNEAYRYSKLRGYQLSVVVWNCLNSYYGCNSEPKLRWKVKPLRSAITTKGDHYRVSVIDSIVIFGINKKKIIIIITQKL